MPTANGIMSVPLQSVLRMYLSPLLALPVTKTAPNPVSHSPEKRLTLALIVLMLLLKNDVHSLSKFLSSWLLKVLLKCLFLQVDIDEQAVFQGLDLPRILFGLL